MNGVLVRWDLQSMSVTQVIKKHKAPIASLSVEADSLYSASEDGIIRHYVDGDFLRKFDIKGE